jgi:hypothetical protein
VSWELPSLDTFIASILWDYAPNIAFIIAVSAYESVEWCYWYLGHTVHMVLMDEIELAL